MRESRLSRRAFLAGSAATLAAVACGRGGRSPLDTPEPGALQLVTTSVEHVVGDHRLSFAVFRGEGPLRGTAGSGTLRLLGPEGAALGPFELRTFEMAKGLGGEAEVEQIRDLLFVADVPFETDGFYEAEAKVTIDDRDLTALGRIGIARSEHSQTVAPGGDAIPVATPTLDDSRGVDPICTRTPMCDMHAISLDEALASGAPVVVSFATPALCASRFCGPVIDIVEDARHAAGEGVHFVHAEIYTDLQAGDQTDAVKAWTLPGEPFIFFVNTDGRVVERISGPVGQWEIEDAVGRLKA